MQFLTTLTSKKALSIIGALSVSGAMIFVAYFISGPNFFTISGANAEDTRKLLEAYAVKDSDKDGLPDWQEALYATNPQDAHSVDKIYTDSEAVAKGLVKPKFESAPIASSTVDIASVPGVDAAPTTLTDQFAQELFKQYLENQTAGQGQTATPAEVASFVTGAVGELNGMYVLPETYRISEVSVRGEGAAALATYVRTAEPIFFTNTPGLSKDETSYFYDAVTNNDAVATKNVAKIGAWYTRVAKTYIGIAVPKEASAAHLRLANALNQMGAVVSDMALIDTDPLRSLLAIGKYDAALKEMLAAMNDMSGVLARNGVYFPEGTSGALFITMVNAK